MFSCSFKPVATAVAQKTITVVKQTQRNYKVTVAGAAGSVGQPLSLLLKLNPLVSKLALFDVMPATPGISEDVSHVDTMAQVTCHTGTNELVAAIKGADVVIHTPDIPRKASTSTSAFEINAFVTRDLAVCISQNAPKAMTVIISNLISSLVPVVSEVMIKAGVYDPGRIFGMTTLDSIRASVFIAQTFGIDPRTVSVPVIGGGSTNTTVPVFSQCKPSIKFRDQEQIKALTIRVREAGDKMMIAKAGTGSATLSMGYAAARMVDSILRGMQIQYKVVVTGGSGGIGQPLALLLKQAPLVTRLAVYDIAPITPGVAVDLSHMNTPAIVTGHTGPEQLPDAIIGSDVVVVTAGVPRKPGMSRDDLFNTNADIVRELAESVAKYSPSAIIAIITNPVNSMVPIACEVMKKARHFDPARILGVTTLDVVRSAAFIGQINCVDPRCVYIPVIGGHAGTTIIPLLSQSNPPVNLTNPKDIVALTKRIQEAGTEVVKAKAGGGSATLSMAYAALRITNAILKGLNGVPNVVECAYVHSNVTQATYFANPVMFGPYGIEKNLGFGIINDYEKKLVKAAIPILIKNIKSGENFVSKK